MSLRVKLAGRDAAATPSDANGIFPIPNNDIARVQTLSDLALTEITLDQFPAVKAWRDKLFAPEGMPEICGELPTLLTDYMRSPEARGVAPAQRRARALHHVFTHKQARVGADDLLPGSTTTSFVGPPVYVDTIGYCIWPELKSVATRPRNPFRLRPELATRLNREIFPFWMERNRPVAEAARAAAYDSRLFPNRDRVDGDSIDPELIKREGETPRCQALMERVAFYLSDKATCVSHTVPDWDRLLRHGLAGLRDAMRRDLERGACDAEGREFLAGVIATFDGAINYASRLAAAASAAGNRELAAVCAKVPAGPATTLHEALTSIWICYHLLLQENTNFGLSLGRLDQLLNPFYLSDYAAQPTRAAKAAYVARAVELVCHFFLRCSDHVPLSTSGSETLFAGSGSNQALTVGGTRYENGEVVDAVNDMTYIILKATEILGIRDPNVHARYDAEVHHRDPLTGRPLGPGEPGPYLLRLAQLNILTGATPGIHGDRPVVESMRRYYAAHAGVSDEEALADACDYASIGCIEQNAAGRHYGNTGSTLLVLPAVLELALFGGKHRSDGVGHDDPNLLRDGTAFTSPPLTAMRSMDEFVEAFRVQLDALAAMVVRNNNYFGRFMERDRASPFLSGLFTGPTNRPGESGASFRDVAAGGAKYNSAGVAIIGLADVVDSFCVLHELVFGGKVKAEELLAAMEADFGASPKRESDGWWPAFLAWLRRLFGARESLPTLGTARLAQIRRLLRTVPRYGAGVDQTPGSPTDNRLAIHYTGLLTRMIHETFFKYRTHRGGRYLAGYWSMTNHAGFGMLTRATPNGRPGGHSFASGITPCSGIVKRNGEPTMILDQMLSVAAVDPTVVQNGYTYNLSLTTRGPEYRREDAERFAGYLRGFAGAGGVLVQMCISSIGELQAADEAATAAAQPGAGAAARQALARYQDLMIRVAGYSAYFVTLSPQMRREIIDRANFSLADGVEQHAAGRH